MRRNVELKARVEGLAQVESIVARLADAGPVELQQRDTFFAAAHGRLKLRTLPEQPGELIYYERGDETGPRTSEWAATRTLDPDRLRSALTDILGRRGTVEKTRRLYRIGRARVHLDSVSGLGEFVELEIVLTEGESEASGRREAEELLARLGIDKEALVARAYTDLLVEE